MSVLRYRSRSRAEVELVPYRTEDSVRVAALLAACQHRNRAPVAVTLARWKSFSTRPALAGNVLLAEEDGELRGLAWLMHEASHGRPSRQFRIVVPPRERRRGIASALLGGIETRSREAGSILQCETFLHWRPACAFLARQGFCSRPSLERMECVLGSGELPAPLPGYRARTADTEEDRRNWCALHAQCFAHALHYQAHEPADAAALAAEPGFVLTLVESDSGEFAGYARASKQEGTRGLGVIDEVAVDREHRRRGLGRFLVRDALARLAAGGVRRCELYLEHDAPVPRRLYVALGFEAASRMQCWTRGSATSVKAGRR